MPIQRQVARKVWISQITGSAFVKQEGWNPSYVEVNGEQVSRVNLLATVVSKFLSDDGNYGAMTLDDSSDTIRVKAFSLEVRHVKNTKVGDLVRLIGKIKNYNEETYIAPEAIRVETDPNWLTVQRIELGNPPESKAVEEVVEETKEQVAEEKPEETKPKVDIIEIIRELDKGEGASLKEVIKKTGLEEAEAKGKLTDLLSSGEIFEPKKGKLKVLD